MDVNAILALIDLGQLVLPRFQRGYVWKRTDVSKLMRSLYKGYPVGSLLIWDTQATASMVRGNQKLSSGGHKLLLDGQQRVTSLYGIIHDKIPTFCDGSPHSFRNLYFNVCTEAFEFYRPSIMKTDKLWISVTELMQKGVGPFFPRFAEDPNQELYVNRMIAITSIKVRNFHIETVAGADKTMDVVVDIFNQVNSGGTKLSKGDLALAKISAYWPQAREEMQRRLDRWSSNGYRFNLDWMLRCINAVLTGQSEYEELDRHDFTEADIQNGLQRSEQKVDSLLNIIGWRLGLDYHQVLGSPNSLHAMVRFLDKRSSFPDQMTMDRLLFWYVHALLWGRYSGPIETVIRQDIMALDNEDDPIGKLIDRLRQNRGSLRVEEQDFAGWNRGSRFYPLLYMLTRVYGARDFGFGSELKKGMPGGDFQLELHHVFPKGLLRDYGYRAQVEANAVANFTFLYRKTNREIGKKPPEDYFPAYEAKHPGVLASHWIPDDPQLWKIENYREFLAKRRELLAKAANEFLDQLYQGKLTQMPETDAKVEWRTADRPVSIDSDDEEVILNKAMDWMEKRNLPRGDFGYELVDDAGNLLATLDLAWPSGIQERLSHPVALLIDESDDTLSMASANGFTCFTVWEQLKRHVQRDILGELA